MRWSVVLGAVAAMACADADRVACEAYLEAATTCYAEVDLERPASIDPAVCEADASGEAYWTCLAEAYADVGCAAEDSEALAEALFDCVVE